MFTPATVTCTRWKSTSATDCVLNILDNNRVYCSEWCPKLSIPSELELNEFYERGRDHSYHDLLHSKLVLPGGIEPMCSWAKDDMNRYFGPIAFGQTCNYVGRITSSQYVGVIPRTTHIVKFLTGNRDSGRWTKETRGSLKGHYVLHDILGILIYFEDHLFRVALNMAYSEETRLPVLDVNAQHHCSVQSDFIASEVLTSPIAQAFLTLMGYSLRDSLLYRADNWPPDDTCRYRIFDAMASAFMDSMEYYYAFQHLWPDVCYVTWNRRYSCNLIPISSQAPRSSRYLFNEPWWLRDKQDVYLLGKQGGQERYFLNNLKQHAFIDAVTNMPRLNDNSISNIKEIGGFIWSLVTGREIQIPKSLSSAWLAYRYQYTTTRLDIEEAVSFVRRHADLMDQGSEIVSYGEYSDYFQNTYVTARCQVKCVQRELSIMKDLLLKLDNLGLTPDFYVIWDMIPYSFIVDWFIPVGDVLSVLDAERTYSEANYDYKLIGYSIKYQNMTNDGLFSVYARWSETRPPELNSLYWFENQPVSDRVIGFRAIDALSLTIGGR